MHDKFPQLISLALDDRLGEGEHAMLLAHVEVCQDCADLWRSWKAIDDLFAQAPVLTPRAGLVDAVVSRLSAANA